jgi:aryl-alcohol dehydrogenase-like predicted oxidoreductase
MQLRTIGTHKASAIGLGGMPMSIEGRPDEARSIATIHAALDAGVTLIDTADAYHVRADEVGHSESLVARALARPDTQQQEDLVPSNRDLTGTVVARRGGLRRDQACTGGPCRITGP